MCKHDHMYSISAFKFIEGTPGNSEAIIDQALKTLGLLRCDLLLDLGLTETSSDSLAATSLRAGTWVAICRYLCIPVDSILSGYSREQHEEMLYKRLRLHLKDQGDQD